MDEKGPRSWEGLGELLSAAMGLDQAPPGLQGSRKDGTAQDTGPNLYAWLKVTEAQEHTQR